MTADPLAGPSNIALEANNETINPNICNKCLNKKQYIAKLRYRHKKKIGMLKAQIEKLQRDKNNIRKILFKLLENKIKK